MVEQDNCGLLDEPFLSRNKGIRNIFVENSDEKAY
jgi:hypothetical protein